MVLFIYLCIYRSSPGAHLLFFSAVTPTGMKNADSCSRSRFCSGHTKCQELTTTECKELEIHLSEEEPFLPNSYCSRQLQNCFSFLMFSSKLLQEPDFVFIYLLLFFLLINILLLEWDLEETGEPGIPVWLRHVQGLCTHGLEFVNLAGYRN